MEQQYSFEDIMLAFKYLEKHCSGNNITIKYDDNKNLQILAKNSKNEDIKIVIYKIYGDGASRMATITEENWLKSKI